jgi:hypothetical protein
MTMPRTADSRRRTFPQGSGGRDRGGRTGVVRQNPDRRTRVDRGLISSQSQLDDYPAPPPSSAPVSRQKSAGGQVVDLAALIRTQSQFDDRPPTPPFPTLPVLCGSHRYLALENLALRQQLAVYKKTLRRPKLHPSDRLFWIGLSRLWAEWRQALIIVTPDTVLRWHRRRFRDYWTKLSRRPPQGPVLRHNLARLVWRTFGVA